MSISGQYLHLCWMSGSPLELPRSTRFFYQHLLFNFAAFFFIQFNMTDDIESVSEVIFETLLSLGFIASTLWLNKSSHAYIQVGSAILFCQNVLALFLIPIMFWVTGSENWGSYSVLALVLLWNWLTTAHIFRMAYNINRLAGLVMSLFYLLISFGGGFAINSFLTG